jgi:single-strand DNA-binding protein
MVLSLFQSMAFPLCIALLQLRCSAFTSPENRLAHYYLSVSPHRPHATSEKILLKVSKEDYDDDDNDDNNFIRGGGNFFEAVEKPSLTNNEEELPMSLEELEMLATPFDEHLPKINTVTLVGRVGNDPEPRYFDDGKVVLNLSLAVKRKYHPLERKVRAIRSGEEETDWFPLEFWGRDAEYVTNFVERGSRIGITGSLVVDGWVDKMTGEQRRRPKILVRHIDIIESRAEAELRKSNKGSNDVNTSDWKKKRKNNDDYDDDGASPAGTGGFFS